jgi:MinD-like ATPase involved in chromosome partitioning or flagellar assembly
MGIVITFYSYKGGVGRSMGLANTGALLASWGKKVLLVDWDLEAPGLENFFNEIIDVSKIQKNEGLIDLLLQRKRNKDFDPGRIDWTKILVDVPQKSTIPSSPSGKLSLLTAGKRDENYTRNVRELDFDKFYEESQGGRFLENLREAWIREYDFILIDSRTGLTDSSGICSIQMPDILVLLFTATDQGFRGTMEVAAKAVKQHDKIIFDRFNLKLLPIPTRFDQTEKDKKNEWLDKFAHELKDVYSSWVPDFPSEPDYNIDTRDLIEITKIPYIPYYSYGEKIVFHKESTKDPQGIGYAYETIAALLAHKLEGARMLVENRGDYVRRAKENRTPDEKITSDGGPEPLLAEKTKSKGLKILRGALILITLVAIWLAFNPFRKDNKYTEIQSDSLARALQKSAFINEYKIADTSNINSTLALKKSLYTKNLQNDSSAEIKQIKSAISRILRNNVQFDLPLLYQELAQGKFDPYQYYADTVTRFLHHEHVALSDLVASGYFKIKGYNNTIENDSIASFTFDSTGYTVVYDEIGNFEPGEKSFVRSENRIKVPVTIKLNDAFKITSVTYGKVETTQIAIKKNRIRVDIFTVGSPSAIQLYLTEIIFAQLQRSDLYLPRKRVLSDSLNNNDEDYHISSNQIRFNHGEEKFANEIAMLALKATGKRFQIHPVSSITEDYLSVFIFDENRSIMQKGHQ